MSGRAGTSAELSAVRWYEPAGLEEVPGLRVRQALRHGGLSSGAYDSLNLGRGTGDDLSTVLANRRRFAAAAGFSLEHAVQPELEHGAEVWCVRAEDRGLGAISDSGRQADALVTDLPATPLLVTTADCVPVFLGTKRGRAIGLVHAGWRGVVAGVLPAAIARMEAEFGTEPSQIRAGFGAAIGACCFEVGEDTAEALAAVDPACVRRDPVGGRLHADLVRALGRQLLERGVRGPVARPPCTRCRSEDFFSHRANGGRPGGRSLSVIWQDTVT